MATALEQAFIVALNTAESTRQAAKASAFTTYGFVAANLAAYRTAVIAADVAYIAAMNSAASTAGITPLVAPEMAPWGGNISTVAT